MYKKVFGLSLTVVTKGICGVLRRERPDAMAAPTVNVSLEAELLGGTPQQPESSFCIAIADAYKTGNRLPAIEHVRALASLISPPMA
ncbi:hypothetical protein BJ165DRAFT_1478189 [Panaeolus papilionaceus]|nr:hypothetical protein BJ165DRAFT_1478189 [Panaeolus papilionaceus]